MVCGQSPVPAAQRLVSDSNPRARTLEPSVPEYLSEVLWLGLKLKPVERIQTVPQLFKALTSREYTEELTRSLPHPAPRQLALPDEEQKQHMLSLRNLLAAILVLLAILILLMLWGMVSQGLHTATPPAASSSVSAPESTVLEEPVTLTPNFVGMDYDAQVRNNHNYVGDYLFYVTMEYSDTVEKGKIIRQEPEAGDVIEKGGTVSLVVSKGPQLVQMPDVIGFTQEGAVSELESRGLTPSCFMVVNDGSYAAGCVVSCSVDAGTPVEVGSVITVYIAADPNVEITAEPPAASAPDSESSASSGETPADDTQ